jgi:hypothetical protein
MGAGGRHGDGRSLQGGIGGQPLGEVGMDGADPGQGHGRGVGVGASFDFVEGTAREQVGSHPVDATARFADQQVGTHHSMLRGCYGWTFERRQCAGKDRRPIRSGLMNGRSVSGPALTLEESGRLIGQYRWIEMRAFEILGGWVPGVPELDVKLSIAAHAPHHAWHASLWRDRLPDLAGVDHEALTVPANPDLATFVDALGEATGAEGTIEKLVGIYRILIPRLIARYSAHLEQASPITDGPTIRSLRLVLRDELEDWREGEMLIQSLLVDGATVRRAADRQARLEARLVAAGGISGPPFVTSGNKAPRA